MFQGAPSPPSPPSSSLPPVSGNDSGQVLLQISLLLFKWHKVRLFEGKDFLCLIKLPSSFYQDADVPGVWTLANWKGTRSVAFPPSEKYSCVCVCVRRFLCGKGFFLCASVFKKIKKISMTCKGTPRPHRVLTNFLTSFKDLDGC